MKRVAIYVRVSTLDQNHEMQREELERYISARGWKIASVFDDKSTGRNTNRSGFTSLMKAVRGRKVDAVVVWKLDRAFRSLTDMVRNLNEMVELGVEFVSLKEQVDLTTATGRLMTNILGAFAEFEADIIKDRVKTGIENRRRKGLPMGRPKIKANPKVIQLAQQGKSTRAIAAELNMSQATVYRQLKVAGL